MAKYINTDELLQGLDNYKFEGSITDTVILAIKAFVSALPAANVRPVLHAHCIDRGNDCFCSNCNSPNVAHGQRYCPDCGALMNGKDNNAVY